MDPSADQVHHPAEVLPRSDRKLHRESVGGDPILDLLQHAVEVGVLLLHHRHEKKPGNSPDLTVVSNPFGADLHAGGGAHDNDGRIRDAGGRERVSREVEIAGSVHEIELALLPFRVGGSQLQRDSVVHLLRRRQSQGVALVHVPSSLRRPGDEGERVHERRLARTTMSEEGDVSNVLARVFLRGSHRLFFLEDVHPDAARG